MFCLVFFFPENLRRLPIRLGKSSVIDGLNHWNDSKSSIIPDNKSKANPNPTERKEREIEAREFLTR